ncbi:hypothetical protein MATL_G00105470 [Megalops atlanticus]|uniref:PNPLA domain-containing protein n=1 Tax=Megalops atlanticus TaxID=7932 RepID=A0A9D3T6A4_MEGAT|nr:hypothetical protein MATL_G00105470 [Megalops atlanticus]
MSPKSGTGALSGKAPLSISFSGSGFLAVYQLGVAQCLLDVAPEVLQGAPEVYGASAGSLAAAAVVCGTNMGRVRDEMIKFTKVSRGHILGPLHPSVDTFKWIEQVLRRVLPDNAHLLASGRLHVSTTRIPDGKNILISEFESKEDVVQALLCSCFLPMYCGLMPPSYKGVHYIDGGFTSIQPTHDSHRTLTVSPFAGDVDICPSDERPNRYDIVVSGCTFHLTSVNFFRMMDALLPPTCTDLKKAFDRGYQDALSFLQKSDLIEYRPFPLKSLGSGSEMDSQALLKEEEEEVEKEREEEDRESPAIAQEERNDPPEGFSPGTESLPWNLISLEQALYPRLPVWVQTALLCNLMAQFGLANVHSTFFPARLISYLLLPYTLPACVFLTFSYRLLLWLRNVPERASWLWQDVRQIVLFFTNITVSSLKRNLTDRFLPSFILAPALEVLTKRENMRETPVVCRRSTLRIQLSTSGSTSGSSPDARSHTHSESLAFAFLLNLEVQVDDQPDAPALPPCQQHPSTEGEDDQTATPHIAFLGGEKEEDGPQDRSTKGGSELSLI